MMISWLIDIVILLTLAITLTYAAVLARRVARLQNALIELAPALQAFCDAVDVSERSVGEIRRETDRFAREAERARAALPQDGVLRADPRPPRPRSSGGSADRVDLVRMFFETAKARAR